jgi:hypothetical protein
LSLEETMPLVGRSRPRARSCVIERLEILGLSETSAQILLARPLRPP